MRSYEERQARWVAENEVTVGTRVEVMFCVPDYCMGWNDEWNSNMSNFIGQKCTVVHTDRLLGVEVEWDSQSYFFPYFCLNVIHDVAESEGTSKINDRLEQTENTIDALRKGLNAHLNAHLKRITDLERGIRVLADMLERDQLDRKTAEKETAESINALRKGLNAHEHSRYAHALETCSTCKHCSTAMMESTCGYYRMRNYGELAPGGHISDPTAETCEHWESIAAMRTPIHWRAQL